MSEATSHLSFLLGGRRHAIPMACVQELVYVPMLQPTERVPGNILGLLNLRGAPIPVLDLTALLGLEGRPVKADDILLVFRAPSGAGPYGLLMEAVEDLLVFDLDELKPPMADPEAGSCSPLVAWLGLKEERLYHLLDLDLVVSYALGGRSPSRYEDQFTGLDEGLEALLKHRAEAATGQQAEANGVRNAFLEFRLGGERFALPLRSQLQIAHCPPVFPVPGAPPAMLGLANLAGETLLVVDLRPLLGMPPGALLPEAYLLVVEDGAGALGLYADDVGEILDLDPGRLLPHPAQTTGPLIRGEWLERGHVYHVLDLTLVLAHPALTLSSAHP